MQVLQRLRQQTLILVIEHIPVLMTIHHTCAMTHAGVCGCARGVAVLIDGAHALGQLPVNLSRLAPDYWVTNCHKWWAGARGSALLFVAEGRQGGVRPLVVSHGSGAGFTSDFIWDGEAGGWVGGWVGVGCVEVSG
jgi:kynureninase